MREKITEVRDKLANKDEMDPEEIKSTVSDLQQSSLKLFEIAYKKVTQTTGCPEDGSNFDTPLFSGIVGHIRHIFGLFKVWTCIFNYMYRT